MQPDTSQALQLKRCDKRAAMPRLSRRQAMAPLFALSSTPVDTSGAIRPTATFRSITTESAPCKDACLSIAPCTHP